ncbi:MAG: metallophosphoesterase [Actinomycetota bacterium]
MESNPTTVNIERSLGTVLVVADFHGHRPHLDWVLANSDRYDLVALPGDFDDAGMRLPGALRTAITTGFVTDLAERVPVAVCSGNHDLDAVDADGERHSQWVRDLPADICGDGNLMLWDNVAISSLPWWDGPNGRRRLDAELAAHAPLVGDRQWLWLHHAPVAGTMTAWDGCRDCGDSHLADLIDHYQPWLAATGHIHDAPFTQQGSWIDRRGETWVLNPGHQRSAIPSCIELDLSVATATWSGDLAGARRQEHASVAAVELMPAA